MAIQIDLPKAPIALPVGLIEIRFILRDQHSSENTITNDSQTRL